MFTILSTGDRLLMFVSTIDLLLIVSVIELLLVV